MNKYNLLSLLLCFFAISSCKPNSENSSEKLQVEKPIGLSVSTYNVHYFAGGSAGIRKTINKIKPDVIALQEVLVKKRDYSRALAKSLKYYHASSYPYQVSAKSKWVLSFLSVYPIRKKDERKLGLYRRAFRIFIEIKGQKISLVTTHLSPFVWSSSNLFLANKRRSAMRQREIDDLEKWIGKPKIPTILLGDFNSMPFMGEMEPLYELGFTDVCDEADIENRGTFPVKKYFLSAAGKYGLSIPDIVTLDYILISGGIKASSVSIDKSRASDHFPLSAKIIINRKQ